MTAKNLVGIGTLLTSDEADLETINQIEQEILNGRDSGPRDEIDAAQQYKLEMQQLSKSFDLADGSADDGDGGEAGSSGGGERGERDSYKGRGHSHDESDAHIQPAWESNDKQLQRMTQEEQRQRHINSVLNDIDNTGFGPEFNMDKERDEDEKTSLLEQIDALRNTLYDDGIDISGVPTVTRDNKINEIKDVYKILRLKNDRSRYCSFANELILAGAYGLEGLFDGKKEWFGHTPDLTGWPETVKVKLRRMRYETSTLVQSVMQNYQMGPGWRLILELIPSVFLYSRSRRITQHDNLMNDDSYRLEQEARRATMELNTL